MKQAVYCSVSYLVDFIKLFGAVFFIFDLKMKDKRNTLIFSAAAFVLVSIVSYQFDLTKNTIIYSIVAICTVALCLKNKKQVWNVIAVMLIINFIDTIILSDFSGLVTLLSLTLPAAVCLCVCGSLPQVPAPYSQLHPSALRPLLFPPAKAATKPLFFRQISY